MNRGQPDLSVIIPALNEAPIIADTLRKVHDFMAKKMPKVAYEIIVVAAKDKDNTAQIARDCAKFFAKNQLQVITPSKRIGKGRDVALGFKHAKGIIQIFTDADLALPLINMSKAYNLLQMQQVLGNKAAVFAVRSQKHASPVRKFISIGGSIVTRLLFFTDITDLQCGLKGFTADAAQIGFKGLKTTGWMFDVEVFKKLKAAKIPVIPLDIDRWDSDTHHLGGENLIKASIGSLIEMFKIRFSK